MIMGDGRRAFAADELCVIEEVIYRLSAEWRVTTGVARVKIAREVFRVASSLETISADALLSHWRQPDNRQRTLISRATSNR